VRTFELCVDDYPEVFYCTPTVGDEFELVVRCRVYRVEADLVDTTHFGARRPLTAHGTRSASFSLGAIERAVPHNPDVCFCTAGPKKDRCERCGGWAYRAPKDEAA
jgi:hypothetical protein